MVLNVVLARPFFPVAFRVVKTVYCCYRFLTLNEHLIGESTTKKTTKPNSREQSCRTPILVFFFALKQVGEDPQHEVQSEAGDL